MFGFILLLVTLIVMVLAIIFWYVARMFYIMEKEMSSVAEYIELTPQYSNAFEVNEAIMEALIEGNDLLAIQIAIDSKEMPRADATAYIIKLKESDAMIEAMKARSS